MACCGKLISKKKKVIIPKSETESIYVEGQDGYIEIRYVGDIEIKVTGCETKNRYLFSKSQIRLIDKNDASCLFDLKPGSFEEVLKVAESDYSESEPEYPEN